MPETALPDERGIEEVDNLPVIVAVDVGELATPDGPVFGVLRIRWSTAADYEGGDNDVVTTMILPTVRTAELLVQDMTAIIPNLTPDPEIAEEATV